MENVREVIIGLRTTGTKTIKSTEKNLLCHARR